LDNTKYQVFISSTFADLSDERRQILNILLMADCIPAGMENFVATDDEQFNVIKKVIDLCDYYILIIGKRYGSINEKTGISYTEMEYNYAIDKGIPVLVFALDDSIKLPERKIEKDDIKKGKLAEFKNKAMKNRLASVWKDSSDLVGKVAIAIMQAIKEIKRPGWHRGNDEEKATLLKQIAILQKENEDLKKGNISEIKKIQNEEFQKIFYNKKITLHFTERVLVFSPGKIIKEKTIETTYDELFKFISLRITNTKKADDFKDAISSFRKGYYVDEQDALIVRNIYEQLGLIKSFNNKDNIEMVELTKFGKEIMNQLNTY